MNQITKFFNGNEVRVVEIEGNPWFVAKDICDILEIGNPSQALSRLDTDEKSTIILNEGIGNPNKAVVNEFGLYALINGSRKPQAKQFQRWVNHEVLPTIRKTGGYVANDDLFIQTYLPFADEQTKLLFGVTLETVRKQNEVISRMKPKVEQYDRFISAENFESLDEVSKSLGVGVRKLITLLKVLGVFHKKGRPRPKQQFINEGCFVVKQIPSPKGDFNYTQTFVTAKGIERIDRFLQKLGGAKIINSMKLEEIKKIDRGCNGRAS